MISRIREVAQVMREVGARRVRLEGLEIELGPLPAPGGDDKLPPSTEGLCECGHPFLDHNEHGCLLGCSVTICNRSATESRE